MNIIAYERALNKYDSSLLPMSARDQSPYTRSFHKTCRSSLSLELVIVCEVLRHLISFVLVKIGFLPVSWTDT
jgi:hypothetical protein